MNALRAGADAQRAAMLVDDLLADPQAETVADGAFRCKERLEYVRKRRCLNAAAIVRDRDPNAAVSMHRIARDGSSHRYFAILGDGVKAVQNEV